MRITFKVSKKSNADNERMFYEQRKGETFDTFRFKEYSGIDVNDKISNIIQGRIDNLEDREFILIGFKE